MNNSDDDSVTNKTAYELQWNYNKKNTHIFPSISPHTCCYSIQFEIEPLLETV